MRLHALALFSTLPLLASAAPDYRIQHLEPMFWWTGMAHRQLQLMVHGPRIAELEPVLNYPGVRLKGVQRSDNPNYLFLDLELADSVQPGSFELAFQRAGKTALTHSYHLLARQPGSAQRQGFSSADTIYQLMPDRFANGNPANDSLPGMGDPANRRDGSGRHGGDLQGMGEHLGYIADMGFTQIWPTPLLESDMLQHSYHGYAATNHYRIDPRYGSNEDYRRYVAQARAQGMGVIQDVVLNHIGSRHWWMQDMPARDWITHQGKYVPTAHHRAAVQDPYASQEDVRNFTSGWFVDSMPDLNQANPLVAAYLIQNSIWWIEYAGLSGLRVDTFGYSDNAFLSQWSQRMMQEYPKLNLVGEEWSTHIPFVARWQEGKQNHDGYRSHMPSMMDFPLNDVLRKALVAGPEDENGLKDLYETLAQDHLYPNPGQLVLFEGNHDLSRLYSALNSDPALFRMAIAYVLTVPRIPQFYYGTEILMPSSVKGRDDPSYRQDFPGGWPGDKVNAFTGEGLNDEQRAAQAFVKKLVNWRKTQPLVHHGKMMHYGPENEVYVYFRYEGQKKLMVILNKNLKDVKLSLDRFHEMLANNTRATDIISGKDHTLSDTLPLPARSPLILELH
ncbi:glycoside hydrolase family 13 protein [Massilia sp. erpn]|uniref:glycoside hydrolase family 13 protein n=1 Tax=Massilia sp. erpn TaxID=2738142 RepID=UPI002103A4E9|nr:glycoside hydrolase family 13 protein [Massilia sp. erpn]UTY58104.1 glycoside hydrolase family 13 protein [Massilia sp. erpn]